MSNNISFGEKTPIYCIKQVLTCSKVIATCEENKDYKYFEQQNKKLRREHHK